MTDCDVVLGGIRTILDGKNIEERNPKTIKTEEVFSTNPGWQGSNTFIRTKTIIEAVLLMNLYYALMTEI